MSSFNPSSTSLTANDLLHIPADLNVKTPEQKQVYSSALEFERFFVQQMLKPMANAGKMLGADDSSGSSSSGGDDNSTDSSMSGYKDMAQDQMTQAVLDGGGLGIAATLYQQMAESAGVADKTTTGTTHNAAPTTPAAPAGDTGASA